ncbi:MAG: prepilin-type N-terminal cleavage/methylation domain-containing protein [Elusimicrobiaceae bacterium]|nr:prepilin-type N-terminal cleavage/methylation domain-containing protein [Elusimicrobiaceae bacterium]
MTKKGFTLMELLVSIFITGMVMLSLVAMWRSSSNHTAQAQRQSIIRNESTLFLRRIYSDFVSASEIICPWFYSGFGGGPYCSDSNMYIAVKEAVIDPDSIDTDSLRLKRITGPVCGSSNNIWATSLSNDAITRRCITPSYVVYTYEGNKVYRCDGTFLNTDDETIEIGDINTEGSFIKTAIDYCSETGHKETVLPYVESFNLSPHPTDLSTPQFLINYTIKRDFEGMDVPPVYFRFTHLLTIKRGI